MDIKKDLIKLMLMSIVILIVCFYLSVGYDDPELFDDYLSELFLDFVDS